MQRRFTSGSLTLVIGAAVFVTVDAVADNRSTIAAQKREHQAHAQMVEPFFDELDCENLGYVQRGEVEEHIGPIFISFDADGSRDIDPLEWGSFPYMRDKPLLQLSFSVADRDRNNIVSFREFTDYLSLAVAALDADGNGELSPAELQALLPPG